MGLFSFDVDFEKDLFFISFHHIVHQLVWMKKLILQDNKVVQIRFRFVSFWKKFKFQRNVSFQPKIAFVRLTNNEHVSYDGDSGELFALDSLAKPSWRCRLLKRDKSIVALSVVLIALLAHTLLGLTKKKSAPPPPHSSW